MKGHKLPGINQKIEEKNLPDGRAKSSAFQDNKEKKATEKPHWNYGSVNEDGTKVVDKQGNWVSLNRGTEGKAIIDVAKKSGDTNVKKSDTGNVVNQ